MKVFPDDITHDTMKREKLNKLKREVKACRGSPQKATALKSLAKKLGMKSVKRGKEPNWTSSTFTHLRPLSISYHGGRDIPIGTKNSILNELENHLIAWEERLDEEDERRDRHNE